MVKNSQFFLHDSIWLLNNDNKKIKLNQGSHVCSFHGQAEDDGWLRRYSSLQTEEWTLVQRT